MYFAASMRTSTSWKVALVNEWTFATIAALVLVVENAVLLAAVTPSFWVMLPDATSTMMVAWPISTEIALLKWNSHVLSAPLASLWWRSTPWSTFPQWMIIRQRDVCWKSLFCFHLDIITRPKSNDLAIG